MPRWEKVGSVGSLGRFSLPHGTLHATSHKAAAICSTFLPQSDSLVATSVHPFPSSSVLLFASAGQTINTTTITVSISSNSHYCQACCASLSLDLDCRSI
ncbi:hypothetical protein N7G274_009631 [Stereocaulon virgatum]|uniref:Uncharacterized protein n=1 Tax=Stereocaulon virgatum TaxID=373712 RepID=A0ABR3ZYB4_9LECA